MPEIPEGAKTPEDHKKSAVQVEAEGGDLSVTWNGLNLTFPASVDDWPAMATLALEDGKVLSTLRALFGKRQWALVMKDDPKNVDLTDLFNDIAVAAGFVKSGE